MSLLGYIYTWSRISAVVVVSVVGWKGFDGPPAQAVEVPMTVGFGWERTLWKGFHSQPDMPDPIQLRMDKCDRMAETTSRMDTKACCTFQKMKLQCLRHVVYMMRKAYSFAGRIVPALGGGYAVVVEIMVFGGLVAFLVKTQYSCVGMLLEKVCALYQLAKTSDGRVNTSPAEPTGMKQDELENEGNPLDVDDESGGRHSPRFHEEFNEEMRPGNEVCGSEADGKMKKEVRFSDDTFEDHRINEACFTKTAAKGSQRRATSPVKRIPSEPAPRNLSPPKMTRSVPTAGTGAGSQSSWHL